MEMSDNSSYANALVSGSQVHEGIKSLLDSYEGDGDKKSWATLQERISRVPRQVLWYCGRPSKTDIPKGSYCGGLQSFELQLWSYYNFKSLSSEKNCVARRILPQLLCYFGVNDDVESLDWATIVVFMHVKPPVTEARRTKRKLLGFNLLLNQTTAVR